MKFVFIKGFIPFVLPGRRSPELRSRFLIKVSGEVGRAELAERSVSKDEHLTNIHNIASLQLEEAWLSVMVRDALTGSSPRTDILNQALNWFKIKSFSCNCPGYA